MKYLVDKFDLIWVFCGVRHEIICIHFIIYDSLILFKGVRGEEFEEFSYGARIIFHFGFYVQEFDNLVEDVNVGLYLQNVRNVFKVMK